MLYKPSSQPKYSFQNPEPPKQQSAIELYQVAFFFYKSTELQWCPDISPGPVQPDNGTMRGMGHKAVLLPLRCIWLK